MQSTTKIFNCMTCKKEFYSKRLSETRIPKYCSKQCYWKREITNEWIEKISNARKGKTPWNKWIKMWEGKEHPRWTLWMKWIWKWKIVSQETRLKISQANTGKKFPERSGENSHWWRWWVTGENEKVRKSSEYRNWRKSVFARDNYKCVDCGKNSKELQADHIKPFALYKEKRFDINNGRTLCIDCHRKTETYWSKLFKYANTTY